MDEWLRRAYTFIFAIFLCRLQLKFFTEKVFYSNFSFYSDLIVRVGKPEEVLPFLIKSVAATTSHLVFQEEVINF